MNYNIYIESYNNICTLNIYIRVVKSYKHKFNRNTIEITKIELVKSKHQKQI